MFSNHDTWSIAVQPGLSAVISLPHDTHISEITHLRLNNSCSFLQRNIPAFHSWKLHIQIGETSNYIYLYNIAEMKLAGNLFSFELVLAYMIGLIMDKHLK